MINGHYREVVSPWKKGEQGRKLAAELTPCFKGAMI